MQDNIKKLRDLTTGLGEFPGLIVQSDGVTELRSDAGVAFGWSLLYKEEISVTRWFAEAGMTLPIHVHDEKEWLIVYEGKMHLHVNDEEFILGQSDGRYVFKYNSHKAYFPVDTQFIAITVPAAEGFKEMSDA